MSEYAHDDGNRVRNPARAIDQLFVDLAGQFERAALLYANAVYFDPERARQLRQGFDAAAGRAESHFRPSEENVAAAAGGNRSQRIEAAIVSFIQDMAKPVTIDEVLEHLNGCSLGEPRPSLITRMSRMASTGKLLRSGRGYYELTD